MVLNLAGLGLPPLTDRDEAYYANVSREMLERGDFLLPHLNGKPWLEKPPLLYWTQAAAFVVFGKTEFAARLPSALAGAGTAVLVFAMALSMFRNLGSAVRAGMVCALTPAMLAAGRLGMTDLPVVFFTTLATWAGWELLRKPLEAKWRWWWIFYGALAAGMLTKGPVGLLPLFAAGIFVVWTRPPGALAALRPVRGLVLAIGLAGCWYVPVFLASEGGLFSDFFMRHVVERILSPSNGHGVRGVVGYLALLPLYVLLLIPGFFPWVLWLPKSSLTLWKAHSPAGRYLFSGILLVIGLFSLVSTKLPFYILPAFPLLACVAGPALAPRIFRGAAVLMTAAALFGGLVLLPWLGGFLPARALAASQDLSAAKRMAVVDSIEPSFLWYFGEKIPGPAVRIGVEEVAEFLKQEGPSAVVCVSQPALEIPSGCLTSQVEGFNLAKGRWQTFLLIVDPGD
jgi:4-amino-4-deoxy-L-arabinose transferase-like glycosyltransferase